MKGANKMTGKKFNKTEKSILTGMREAVKFAKGQLPAKTHDILVPKINVHEARDQLGLTQKQFATTFGVSVSTLRNWEQGKRSPTGAARVLIKIIQKEPATVKRILMSASG
jgi:putative transcriptional regulator